MILYIATPYGFCSGVKKSISLAEKVLSNEGEVYTLGALVHNPKVIEELSKKGIKILEKNGFVEGKALIVRAHGLPQRDIEFYRTLGNKVYDATCPLVKKVQILAEYLHKNKYKVVIIGEKNHPEVIGILSYTDDQGIVVENEDDIKKIENYPKIGIVFQTTQSFDNALQKVNLIMEKGKEIRIFNTICPETIERQEKAKKMSEMVDLALVLGGKNSANTRRLYITLSKRIPTYHIENIEEIDKSWFKEDDKVGIITGTSTPNDFVEEVVELLKSLYPLEIHLV
ncbi:MAG: 4-hydroxy-3-methylbut-2-enyl diphosphate reductase [Dictyoglomus thermophilum]|nr:4-hydroxy-3-methylbut-2-enyl diphosphate reductase [Dictyoglomus thermophilum]MCX7721028.1 4-hydroxy-3-methylbut-2-enyl diphosphate reductase [Dictyoglomus thermophilum]